MSEGTPQTTELLNADEVARTIARIAHQIIEKTALDSPNAGRVVLLGIPSLIVTSFPASQCGPLKDVLIVDI